MGLIEKNRQLDQLKAQIEQDNVCPELAAQATQLVFGDGNPNADIVLVGEAPGKKEDLSGLPFVGSAGHFLNDMLDMIGLERKNIYITNIVKYRPPENRDPLKEEKLAFLPYLQSQLEIIKPKVVVTLGRHAANCFDPELIISKEHGHPRKINLNFKDQTYQVILLPLFHPAAALYNGSKRSTLMDDFAKIPAVVKLNELSSTRNTLTI